MSKFTIYLIGFLSFSNGFFGLENKHHDDDTMRTNTPKNTQQWSTKKKWIVGISVVLVALVGAGAAYYFLNQNQSNPETPTQV